MVGIAVIAVFACALFLVPNTYAQGNIRIVDTNVMPSKGKYDETFTYVINITANSHSEYSIDVNLTIGSDKYYPSISKTPESCTWKGVTIEKGKITTLSCPNVRFTGPVLLSREFRDWVLEGIDPVWNRAWYQVHIRSNFCTPPFKPCEEKHTDPETGPILTKCILNFYESNVKYNETGCPDKFLFDYDVKVWQNANNTIELQVFNYSTLGWESKGTRNCTTLFANHTLKWLDTNLDRNNLDHDLKGQYRFVVVGGQKGG